MASTFRLSKWYAYLLVFAGMASYHILIFYPAIVPYTSFGPVGKFFHYLAYEHRRLLVIGYTAAWLVHLAEAIYAFILTRANLTFTDTMLWSIQTLLLGFPSLVPLKRILRKKE